MLAALVALLLAASGLVAQESGQGTGQAGQSAGQSGREKKDAQKSGEAAQAHRALKLSKVLGDRVKNQKGDDLGTIQDVVIDDAGGRGSQAGEACYRLKDGLLDRMSMEKQGAAPGLSPSSPEGSVR